MSILLLQSKISEIETKKNLKFKTRTLVFFNVLFCMKNYPRQKFSNATKRLLDRQIKDDGSHERESEIF
jgi:hypothetical protein